MNISLFFSNILFKIITAFFSLILTFTSIFSPVGKELPKVPDDFTPVLRFAVCSDIHLSGEEGVDIDRDYKFASFFDDTYAYAETQRYNKVDAFLVAGDMTGRGKDAEYEKFNSIINSHIKDGSQLLAVLGNHEFIEYRDVDPTVGYDKYKQHVNEDVDTHTIINGYHIIGVSYADDAKTFKGKSAWLKKELDAAVKDDPSRPVFVFQHPHPFATVYGSVSWSDIRMKAVLSQYPQVIDFSGHSHYAANDPRVIWQGSFTAVGTGSLAASIVNIDYIEGDCDAPGNSGTYWIVEADANNNVRLHLYDAASHKFFEKNDYFIQNVTKRSSHYYNWNNLKALDTAPVFPSGMTVSASRDADGNVIMSFPNAETYWGTESYKITVKCGAGEKSDSVISNYVRSGDSTMNVNLSEMFGKDVVLPAGEYSYSITPVSPYAKTGKTVKGTFTLAD